MKRFSVGMMATLLALAASLSARSQVLGPNTYLASESQIVTLGTEVWGGDTDSVNTTLANGVVFNSAFNNSHYVASGFSGSTVQVDQDGSYRGDYTAASGFSDGNLNNVLQYDATGSWQSLAIQGLTPGDSYVLQIFAGMTANGYTDAGEYATQRVTDTTSGGTGATGSLSWGQTYDSTTQTYSGTGFYTITDTFTANSTGFESVYMDNSTNGVAQDAAIQIRDVTGVPEPSTYAMMFGGAAALAWLVRRRTSALR